MKLLFSTFTTALFAVSATNALVDDPAIHSYYFTLGAAGGGCIGLKQGTAMKGDRLILRTCTPGDMSIQWTLDEENRFRNKINADTCMQAGPKNSTATADTPLRMVECGESELQLFDISEFMSEGGPSGHIKIASDPDLCIVHKGPTGQIDKDIIILKRCQMLSEDRALGWEAEFVGNMEEEGLYFSLEAPGGGCIGLKDGNTTRGTALLLRTCSPDDDSLLWTTDTENRFRTKADMTMCMQAGRTDAKAARETRMRIVPCGFSDLQKFNLTEFESALSGPIQPADSPELCVVHRNGPSAIINGEPIVLKDCEGLGDGIRNQGWNAVFPDILEIYD